MILGSGSHQAGRRRFLLKAATGAAVMLLGMVALSGCGGGGDDNGGNINPTPTPNVNATVNGRVIENNTAALVSGAVVTFGGQTVTTGTSGQFAFTVPSGTADTKLTVSFPNKDYNEIGYIRGLQVNITSTGTTISANELKAGQTVNLGDVRVYSVSGPPPPPVFN